MKLMANLDKATPFNLMEYICECIREASHDQSGSCPFAPYIQKLINHVVQDQKFKIDCVHMVYNPEKEKPTVEDEEASPSKEIPQVKIQDEGEGTSSTAPKPPLFSQSTNLIVQMLKNQDVQYIKFDDSLNEQGKLRRDNRDVKLLSAIY